MIRKRADLSKISCYVVDNESQNKKGKNVQNWAIKKTSRKYLNKEMNNRYYQSKKPIGIRKGKELSRKFASRAWVDL